MKKLISIILLFSLPVLGGKNLSSDSTVSNSPKVSADCSVCSRTQAEIGKYKKQSEEIRNKIDDQKKLLQSLGPDSDTKRMATTSSIFVLSAKLETSENWREVNQRTWNANCRTCASSK